MVVEALEKTIEVSGSNTGMVLGLALNYGARTEITDAVKNIARKHKEGQLDLDDIDHECISNHLYTAGRLDPDLLIRTSGEFRLSNYLLWQLAYTELSITDVLWPDFSESDFLDALESYAGRERRFGMTSQQIIGISRKVKKFIFKGEKTK